MQNQLTMQVYPPTHWETNAAVAVRGLRFLDSTVFPMGRTLYSVGASHVQSERLRSFFNAHEQYRHAASRRGAAT